MNLSLRFWKLEECYFPVRGNMRGLWFPFLFNAEDSYIGYFLGLFEGPEEIRANSELSPRFRVGELVSGIS